MSDSKLVILDGHSVAFRAFYALDPAQFRTDAGEYTNAVYGFMNMLIRMMDRLKPTHIAVAFDLSRKSFRTEHYSDYKGTRAETPPEFKGQVERIQQLLDTVGITWLTKENYEADDIVATLARMGREAALNVFIASGDRDTFQLVNDSVTVMYPGSSMSDVRDMTPEAIYAKYAVWPQRYPELAALVGESSDNLPGVPGVGPKTAAQWLDKFDGLDNLLERAAEVGGKRGQALIDHREDVLRNRRLNRLVDDLDLPVEIADLKLKKLQQAELFQLCDTLNFGRIRNRLLQVIDTETDVAIAGDKDAEVASVVSGDPADSGRTIADTQDERMHLRKEGIVIAASGDKDPQMIAATPESVTSFLTHAATWTDEVNVSECELGTIKTPAIYVVGNGQPGAAEAVELVIYTPDEYLQLDLTRASEEILDAVRKFLSTRVVFVHDAKATAHALASRNIELSLPQCDVQLWDYLLRAESENDLDVLCRLYLDKDLPGGDDLLGSTMQALECARITWQIAQITRLLIEQSGHRKLLTDIEEPTQVLLQQMESVGIAIDTKALGTQALDLDHVVQCAQAEAERLAQEPVNMSSPKQLQHILFDVFDMPKTKKTKTGYTTNAKALTELLAKTDHPFLKALMVHRDAIKLRQIIEGLLKARSDDGRIHTTFMQTVTSTGRLSSVNPNLQNIPARSQEGLQIRDGFIVGSGYEALLTADYSQIEMRIMAHLSGDNALIEAFDKGEDLHRTMAAMVFDVSPEDVDATLRSRIKATSYGLAYGLSAFGLSQQLGMSVPEATKLRARYFERFGKVRDYLNDVVENARQVGYTETIMGRRRYLPGLNSQSTQERQTAERAALNAPIQGTAADIIKLAMIRVADALKAADMRSRILLQVHDELVVEVAPGEAEKAAELIRRAMENTVNLSVPLEVCVGVGASWKQAAH